MNLSKNWWKILSVLLLLYTFLAGLLIPLKPGILYITPDDTQAGEEVNLYVKGYNTHYLDAKNISAILRLDSTYLIQAKKITPISQTEINLLFSIPKYLKTGEQFIEASLFIDNEIDGYSLLPGALQITQKEINLAKADSLYTDIVLEKMNVKEGLTFPYRNILYETIRNLFFHVPLWFGMIIIFYAASIFSCRYLYQPTDKYKSKFRAGTLVSFIILIASFFVIPKSMASLGIIIKSIAGVGLMVGVTGWFITLKTVTNREHEDFKTLALTQVGILFGILGLITGAVWAKWTWGEWWSFDVKQNMSAIAMLIYLAYLVLRSSFDDYETQARISSVYNIFAFATLIPLLFVFPRLYDSLHPGNGGNPGLGGEDLDNTMRMVFYPAIIGWTLLGVWLADLVFRYKKIQQKYLEKEEEFYD